MEIRTEQVSKLEAATRQIAEAIRMFFAGRDALATQTVAGAANQLLRDLAREGGIADLVRDNPLVRPDRRAQWIHIVNRPGNPRTHTDKDAAANVSYSPVYTHFDLFEAVVLHRELTGTYIRETLVFSSWFAIKYPDLLVEEAFKGQIESARGKGVNPDDFDLINVLLRDGPAA